MPHIPFSVLSFVSASVEGAIQAPAAAPQPAAAQPQGDQFRSPVRLGCTCGPARLPRQHHFDGCPARSRRHGPPPQIPQEPGVNALNVPQPAAPPPAPEPQRPPLPSMRNMALKTWPLYDSIPQRARASVASAFARTVSELNSPEGWQQLFGFAKIVLARQKSRKATAADSIMARARKYPRHAADMWEELCA